MVENALGIPHAAHGHATDDLQGLLLCLNLLGLTNFLQLIHDQGSRDGAKLEPLAPRDNGGQNFVRFGRGKDELNVGRRFLQGFEERVERLLAKHVNLIDNVDLVTALGRCVLAFVPQVPNLLDRVVGGPVYLDDVQAPALHDCVPNLGIGRNLEGRALLPVQGLGEKACRSRLARAPGTDEEVSVGNPVHLDGIPQRPDDVILAD